MIGGQPFLQSNLNKTDQHISSLQYLQYFLAFKRKMNGTMFLISNIHYLINCIQIKAPLIA